MFYLLLIVFGLCLGSFVNALVWRLHDQAKLRDKKSLSKADKERLKSLSISKGRSMCLSCGHELAGKDLVPVVSWLWLRGKCRYCSARIPDTPVAELLVPLLFVVSYAWWPYVLTSGWSQLLFAAWAACIVVFVALGLYDLRWFLLPDRLTYPLTGLAILFVLLKALAFGGAEGAIGGACLGAIIIAGLFYGLFVVSDGNWIGGGDVKLGVALGLLAGGPLNAVLVILFASVFGLLASVPQIVQGKASGSTKIPFGPFLLLATITAVLWGASLTDAYMNLFL